MKLFSFTAKKNVVIIDQNITYYFDQKNGANGRPYSYQMPEELLKTTTEEQEANPNNVASNMCRHTLLNVVAFDIDETNEKVYIAYENKWLCCYHMYTSEVLSSTLLKKCPCGISLQNIGNDKSNIALIITDKAGDIWGINANQFKNEVRLGGHTASIITDMKINEVNNSKYLLTCDRDEKIRISNFPYVSNIQSYCIGHSGIVVNIDSMSIQQGKTGVEVGLLVSGSWDNTIRLWSFPSDSYACLDAYTTPYALDTNTGEVDATMQPLDKKPRIGNDSKPEAGVGEIVVPSNDGYKVKQYDVHGSEHIPMKIQCFPVRADPSVDMSLVHVVGLVAVMYRKQMCIQIIPIEYVPGSDSDSNGNFNKSYRFGTTDQHVKIELDEFPCDIQMHQPVVEQQEMIHNSCQLVILCSNGLKVVDIAIKRNKEIETSSITSNLSVSGQQLNTFFSQKTNCFTQDIMDKFIGAGGDLSESGIYLIHLRCLFAFVLVTEYF